MIENAVRDFLNALGPDLRRRALFPFEAEERFNWHYIPRERNGVVLKAMNDAQAPGGHGALARRPQRARLFPGRGHHVARKCARRDR